MITFDSETVGLTGPAVLIQWAEDEGEVNLYDVWKEPIWKTLRLIEKIVNDKDGVVGFNLAFDWFQLCKLYTMLSLYHDHNELPENIINELAELEPLARDEKCLKPVSALDLMLHARKGPYQSTMNRGDIRIKRVPTALAWELAKELEKRVKLKDIYFAKRKDKNQSKWQVYDIEDEDHEVIPDFKDIVLRFAPSSALKALAVDALNLPVDTVLLFSDIDLPKKAFPVELGFAPFAKAIGNKENWKMSWPDVIKTHIAHWCYNTLARKYAADDVTHTRNLYKYFGSPPLGDDDSILACMVGAVRWHGFKIDVEGLKQLREETKLSKTKIIDGKRVSIPTAPARARAYVTEFMSETEKLILNNSTKKVLLEEIAKMVPDCDCGSVCDNCRGMRISSERAQEVLLARQAGYEVDLYSKLILAGRLHASFEVIGALSNRMSGAGGDLNTQGIKKEKKVRSKFPLAFPGYILGNGDFDGFEIVLAEACYNDPDLRKDLLSGKKIHALFGVNVYPNMTYEEILATDGTADDKYTRCKSAVFAMLYGGESFTLKTRLGVDLETAEQAYALFIKRYPGVGRERKKIFDRFCSMKQKGGIGTRVEWSEPDDYIESMFGFKRYFTLENNICRALFDLANKPLEAWKEIKFKVRRRADRIQTASGAVQSALYAAAFGLQASNMRAAANHVIQSSGASITKTLQRRIWDVQPPGINEWLVMPFNSHDEIECPCHPSVKDKVKEIVDTTVESFRSKVPLIKLQWKTDSTSWADK